MKTSLMIDGRRGEGGGQVLRTSLSLSAALGLPLQIEHIRGGRKKPGLMRQHLTCVQALARICAAEVDGDVLQSTKLRFEPGEVVAGKYFFAVGSAGSAMLVLQTILPPLLLADGPSEVLLEGGTHNQMAPPFEAIQEGFAPQVEKLGAGLRLTLDRAGFFPAGGGRVRVEIDPIQNPKGLVLLERGQEAFRRGTIHAAHLPDEVVTRQFELLADGLRLPPGKIDVVRHDDSAGPGNAVQVRLGFEHVTEVLTGFGEKSLPSKRVVDPLVRQVRRYLSSTAPVGRYLCDQLMLPMALAAGGRFRCQAPSLHAATQAELLDEVLGEGTVAIEELGRDDFEVRVRGR
ncbi:MAG: RNA 3'-terminal phosphate cyclase [Planctomycetota bacterium]